MKTATVWIDDGSPLTAGHLASSSVPALRNLPSQPKKMQMPGGVARAGGVGLGAVGFDWCVNQNITLSLFFSIRDALYEEQKPAKKFLKQGINVRYISGRLSHNSLSTESPLLRSPFSEGRGACAQAISNNSSIKIKDTTQVLMTSSEDFVISNTAHVLPQNDIFLSSVRREFQLSFLYSFKILKFPKKHF